MVLQLHFKTAYRKLHWSLQGRPPAAHITEKTTITKFLLKFITVCRCSCSCSSQKTTYIHYKKVLSFLSCADQHQPEKTLPTAGLGFTTGLIMSRFTVSTWALTARWLPAGQSGDRAVGGASASGLSNSLLRLQRCQSKIKSGVVANRTC